MSDPRCPNFFILGAAKAGTTTLYDVLREHPDIFMTFVKEPQFFCNDSFYEQGMGYYLDKHFGGSEGFVARGESTPHYLCFDKVAQRIARDIPKDNQRFIVVLRDPTRRAYSLYWNMVSEGVETLSFADALEQEAQRLEDTALHTSGSLRYRYVSGGMYARQIEAYLRHFDKSQFLFLFFEDLVREQDQVVKRVCDFLGVRSAPALAATTARNASNMPRSHRLHSFVRQPFFLKTLIKPLLPARWRYRLTSKMVELNRKVVKYPPLESTLEARLRMTFSDDVRALQTLTNRNLSAWLAPEATP